MQRLFLVPQVPRAKALYTYRGHSPGELRFNKGDIIVLLRQLDENWYLGEVNGLSGVFPASSVQVIQQLPSAGRALCSAELRRDRTDAKDCLTFHKVTPPRSAPGDRRATPMTRARKLRPGLGTHGLCSSNMPSLGRHWQSSTPIWTVFPFAPQRLQSSRWLWWRRCCSE